MSKLGITLKCRIDRQVYDSQLVVKQVSGKFHLLEYLTLTKNLLGRINSWTQNHIPREENTQVDDFSCLASAIDCELDRTVPIHKKLLD